MEPEPFISTLIQVSATILGFVIAITMVVYSFQHERMKNRREELHEILLDLRSYQSIFDEFNRELKRFDRENERLLKDAISNNGIDQDYTVELDSQQGNFISIYYHVFKILDFINMNTDAVEVEVPERESLSEIRRHAVKLWELPEHEDKAKNLFKYIGEEGDIPEDYKSSDLVSPISCESHENISKEYVSSINDLADISGSIVSIGFKLERRLEGVNQNPIEKLYDIINVSIYLALIGVFFPMILLIPLPESFPVIGEKGTFGLLSVLFATFFTLSISITEVLLKNISSPHGTIEKSQYTCFTHFFVNRIGIVNT